MKRPDASHSIQRLPVAMLVPVCGIYSAFCSSHAMAQPIPANDGTGTLVTPQTAPANGPDQAVQFNIEQGSLSGDANTQFHSFESFSLQAGETANFIAPDSVQNIVTSVSGGDASVINGQLVIADPSQANLYLLNPAGVLFGSEATVNLPANLTATTATTLEFEQGSFSATTPNAYEAISGLPTGEFTFTNEPSDITNEGNLNLAENASLSLIGHTVQNSGTITAPSGQITLAAVPGASTVRLGQAGQLLTLEIDPTTPEVAEYSTGQTLSPLALPALLTPTTHQSTNHLSVNPDGTASLTTNPLPIGSTLVSGQISTTSNLQNTSNSGGEINILGSQVALHNATLLANSPNAGGTIRIGGDYQGQESLFTASQTTLDSGTTLSASATRAGNGGKVIVWADDTTQYLGDISARGGATSGDGGFVEVSGKTHLNFQGTVDTRAPYGDIGSLLLDPKNITIVNGFSGANDTQVSDSNVFATDVSATNGTQFVLTERTLANLSGSTAITLEATNNITVQPLDDKTLAFRPGSAPITFRADADGDGAGDFFIPTDHTIIAPGRSLSISGTNLQLGELNTAAAIQGGNITLTASGAITVGNLESFAVSATPAISPKGGDITVTANGDITASSISAENAIQAGNVNLTSQTGNIIAAAVPGPASSSIVALFAPQTISVAGEIIQTAPITASGPSSSELGQSTPASLTQTAESLLSSNLLESSISVAIAHATGSLSALNTLMQAISATDSAAAEPKSASSGSVRRTELSDSAANAILSETETLQSAAFGAYFNQDFQTSEVEISAVKQMLTELEAETGNRSAIIYVKAPLSESAKEQEQLKKALAQPSELPLEAPPEAPPGSFELMLITASNKPVKIAIPDLEKTELLETVNRFRSDLLTSVRRGGEPYLSSAQQLYQWLISPLKQDLETANIDTLVFKLDEGLRTLPLAALHSEEQFLIEQYSLGILPSLGLADTAYASLGQANVLAMGASDFEQLAPLPAVPLELQEISEQWPARTFINEAFTRQNLIQQQADSPAQIIHLATHAEFNAGTPDESYIQLWDEKLRLSELNKMGWDAPALSLLVLSACSTAMGNPNAELGFAGLAIASGAQSVLASLWSVDDIGTLGLMNSFYQQLKASPIKAEALQAAQLNLLHGNFHIEQSPSELENQPTSEQPPNTLENIAFDLSTELGTLETRDFSHPYYWSSFTLIGNPW